MFDNTHENATSHVKSLKVSTKHSTGLLIDIQIEGMVPNDGSLILEVAREARQMIAMRALNDEFPLQDYPKQNVLLREILKGVEIIPMDKTRVFLQSTDYDRLARFFGTEYFPKYNFFRLEPKEREHLENVVFGKSENQVKFLECWTRTGGGGTYVTCDGGGGGGSARNESTKTDGKSNKDKKNSRDDSLKLTMTPRLTPRHQSPNITPKRRVRHIEPRPSGPNGPKITFNNDERSKPSTDQPISYPMAEIIEDTVKNAGLDININSSTGGNRRKQSHHYDGKDVDINRVGGKRVDDPDNFDNVKELQEKFNEHPNIYENYGPALNTKKDANGQYIKRPSLASSHKDHIHISVPRRP